MPARFPFAILRPALPLAAAGAALLTTMSLALLSAAPARAQTLTLSGDRRDRVVTSSGALQDFAAMAVGFSASAPAGGRNAVFLFGLPTPAPGLTLADARFAAYLSRKVNATFGITYSADLYALGIRTLPTSFSEGVFASDYFAGALDATDATLIQNDFAVRLPTDQTGYISTNAAGDLALTTYLGGQYAGGLVGANSFLALRLNPDTATGASSFYEFLSGDTANPADRRPLLTLTFAPIVGQSAIPEPGTLALLTAALLGLGGTGLVRARRRRA